MTAGRSSFHGATPRALTQDPLLGAWRSLRAGRFRPSPALPPADAHRRWLAGIASRQAAHYRDKAHRRHELAAVDPDRLSAFAAPSPEARLVARGLLRAFHRLRPELREILSLAATGLSSHEIAASLSLPRPTVATRFRLARRLFARALHPLSEVAPMRPMSRAPIDAPAETAAELPTATEAALLEMVLGLPGVGPRILGTAALPSLGRLSPAALAERTQIALFDATRLAAAFELGRRYHAARARRGALLSDAARVARYFGPRLASLVHEELWIAALDTHGRVRETRLLARGSDDALYVGRSTVLRTALDMAAHSFVLAHDHPSVDPTPTREDEAMTLELRHLSSELHVPLTAHVIVTPSGRYAAVHE